MWPADDAVRLGATGEILVCLDQAPEDPAEVAKRLESMFTFDQIQFQIDVDDDGATHYWAVLIGAEAR